MNIRIDSDNSCLLHPSDDGVMTPGRMVQVLSTKPKDLFHLRKKTIKPDVDADLVLADLETEAKIGVSAFFFKAKYSPSEETKVVGQPPKTLVSGKLVHCEGDMAGKPGIGYLLIQKSLPEFKSWWST